jgi:hypothetical protein
VSCKTSGVTKQVGDALLVEGQQRSGRLVSIGIVTSRAIALVLRGKYFNSFRMKAATGTLSRLHILTSTGVSLPSSTIAMHIFYWSTTEHRENTVPKLSYEGN